MPGSHFFPNTIFSLYLLGIVLITFSLGMILAAHSVKRRDITIVMPVVMRVMIYTMPCVYPISLVPEKIQPFYFLNPMAAYLQGFRWALWNETAPPMWSIAVATGVGVVALVYGLYAFNKVERTVVDTL